MNNPLGIHSYAWLPAWTTGRGIDVIERASRAGYSRVVVPLRDFAAIEPAAIARACESFGIKPTNTANQLPDADLSSLQADVRQRGIERMRHSFKLARDMGSSHVGGVLYGLLGKASAPIAPDNLKYSAESLALLADEASGMGLKLVLEIVNRYESNILNTVDQALAHLRRIGSDNVYLHLDTFHMNIEEAGMLQAIDAALPHLAYFEIDQNHRGLATEGAIDFTPLLGRLFEAGYKGVIGIEAFSNAVTGADIAAGIGIWRDLFSNGDEVAQAGMAVIKSARAAFERPGQATTQP